VFKPDSRTVFTSLSLKSILNMTWMTKFLLFACMVSVSTATGTRNCDLQGGCDDSTSLLAMRRVQKKLTSAEGGRCCFHMSSCPDDLTADNEVAGCVETTNFCSFSEARCVSPQNTTDGCDGTNTGTENVYCPVGESLQQTKAKQHA
jgi:hypothetical protein